MRDASPMDTDQGITGADTEETEGTDQALNTETWTNVTRQKPVYA